MVTVGSADFNRTDRGAAGERGKGGGQVTKIEWLKVETDGRTDGRGQGKRQKRCWMEVSGSEGVCDELLPRR